MRSRGIVVATSLLFVVAAGAASADSINYDAREAHSMADKNKDGFVDRGEFHVRMVEVFYHADTDKDGLLSPSELVAIDEGMVAAPADDDGDGKLNLSEYVDHRFSSFHKADENEDGLLSMTEVIEAYESR